MFYYYYIRIKKLRSAVNVKKCYSELISRTQKYVYQKQLSAGLQHLVMLSKLKPFLIP